MYPKTQGILGITSPGGDNDGRKTLSFRRVLEHSFSSMAAMARRRAAILTGVVMEREIAQDETTVQNCQCGETVHLSGMYRTSCPCSQQYALGAAKPRAPEIELNLIGATSDLRIAIEKIEQADGSLPHHEVREQWERTAGEHIQRFSYARKKKEEIQAYLPENFTIASGFAMGLPISLYKVISDGTDSFSA
jgi:hypothetical protein